jgi:hypothetical protein
MPIPLPNLDDRRFSDLVEEMQTLLPRYAREWTDHNVSDPGIMLVELFAWLTEALIYRLNRIPEASVARMLELLGIRFQPARPATVSLSVDAEGLYDDLLLPKGTPLRAKPDQGSNTVPFETVEDLELTPWEPGGSVQARQTVLVQDERLGTSDGHAHQAFRLARSFLAGAAAGEPVTCQVTVGGQPWIYKPGLLDLKGHHFAADPRLSVLYFGDGERGRIPTQGAQIAATYRATDGIAGNVPQGTALTVDERSRSLPPAVKKALASGVLFTIRCAEDASGGAGPTGLSEARDMVREDFRTRWRAVTDADFAQIALEKPDLNLARAICVPEMDLSAPDPFAARPGHVSVIVVPNNATVDRPEPSAECLENTWDHLDKRRVITCRHHVVGPAYTEVKIKAEVMRTARSQTGKVREGIEKDLRAFFHPLTGGPDRDKKGWPFGRDVYASEVYQVIENTEGVDHVESLSLRTRKNGSWGEAADSVAVALHSLVYWNYEAGDIEVRIVR